MPDDHSLVDLPISDFLDRLASGSPTPGGGSAGALAGALAASLSSMVCNLTLGKDEFADLAPEIERLLDESEAARAALEFGVEADAVAFGQVAAAYKLPRASEAERNTRRTAIRHGSISAARAPLEVARMCARTLDIHSRLAEIANPRVLTDVAVGAYLARAALRSAAANVEVNLPAFEGDPFWQEAKAELAHLLEGRDAQLEVILARIGRRT